MSVISMKQLLEAGVHFGHQTRRWNPKMAPLAWVTGGTMAPMLSGLVKFYHTPYGGTLIEAELFGLSPEFPEGCV